MSTNVADPTLPACGERVGVRGAATEPPLTLTLYPRGRGNAGAFA